jgi:hypothetical protein
MADFAKLINQVIQKHTGNPDFQADLRKVLGYAAGEARCFHRQFTHDEPRPEHSSETRTLNQLTEQLN